MLTIITTAILTALLSSLLTLGFAHLLFERRYKKQLNEKIDTLRKEMSDEVESKIKKGILSGIAAIPSTDVIKDATRTMAKTGADIVGGSLSTLLGIKTPKDDR